jgi:DNA repair exonuclease SbcCD ATPase subunit
MADNNRIEVPHWMLDADTVAQFFPMAAKEEFQLWRETHIASRILSRMKPGQEWLSGQANVNVQTSSIVMAALASQAHRKTNFDPHKSGSQDADTLMWLQRETNKDDEIQRLHLELHKQEEDHHRKLNDLMAMKSRLERQVQATEIQHGDVKKELNHNYHLLLEREVTTAQADIEECKRRQERIGRDCQDLKRKIQWQSDESEKLDEKLKEETAAKERIEAHLKDKTMQLKEQLQKRLDQVIDEMNKDSSYNNARLLQDLQDVAQKLKVIQSSFTIIDIC